MPLLLGIALILLQNLLQNPEDTPGLLGSVEATVKGSTSWRISGQIEYKTGAPDTFLLVQKSTTETRYTQRGSHTPVDIICDGKSITIYSPPLNRYTIEPLQPGSACAPILTNWASLSSTLEKPELGKGPSSTCRIVQGSSQPEVATAGKTTRQVCIDPIRHVLEWESETNKYGSVQKYVYQSVESNVSVSPGSFQFQPPAGSVVSIYPVPVPARIGGRQLPKPDDLTLPRLKSKVDPEYDEASKQARIEGLVLLYVVVTADGLPSDIAVLRSLSPGLDANAKKTVGKWRFHPAMQGGTAVATPVTIEINYHLARR